MLNNFKKEDKILIYIVSGIPRSGTTMMMRMLEAGGMEVLTDHKRRPDDDNPNGYYEYENVKYLKDDSSWLLNEDGKAIKIISSLLQFLPSTKRYKIIFMQRVMEEILASQKKMLERAEQSTRSDLDKTLAIKFETHLKKISYWLEKQKNINTIYINYRDVLANPDKNAKIISEFLSLSLDVVKMAQVVDKNLYRQRK
jgi:hypothetical protein